MRTMQPGKGGGRSTGARGRMRKRVLGNGRAKRANKQEKKREDEVEHWGKQKQDI